MTQPDPQGQGTPQGGEPQPQGQETPPWGEDFEPEKAWSLIQNLRADKEKLAARPVLDDDAKRKLAQFDKLEAAAKTDLERKTEEATRWQTEAEKWRTTSVVSTIKAIAAPDFYNPNDAINNVDPASYLDAGGQIDEERIKADLAKVLEQNDHYRRKPDQPNPRAPRPNPSQGSGGGRSAPDPAAEFASIIQGAVR